MKEPDLIGEMERITGSIPGVKEVKIMAARIKEWTD